MEGLPDLDLDSYSLLSNLSPSCLRSAVCCLLSAVCSPLSLLYPEPSVFQNTLFSVPPDLSSRSDEIEKIASSQRQLRMSS